MFLLPPLQTLPPFFYPNMVLICYCPVQLLFKISLTWRRTLKRRDSHLAVWNGYDFCCCYLFACFRRQTVLFLLFWLRYSPIPQPRGSLGQHRWPHNQFFSPFICVLHCPLGLGELQTCPFPVVVFPALLLSALSSSPLCGWLGLKHQPTKLNKLCPLDRRREET